MEEGEGDGRTTVKQGERKSQLRVEGGGIEKNPTRGRREGGRNGGEA